MQHTLLSPSQKTILNKELAKYPKVKPLVSELIKKGGQVFLVGGAVRDLVMHCLMKDLDIEVHGLTFAQVQETMELFGTVNFVGKSFGVLRLVGLDIDWSLPRTDSVGRKPEVHIDPYMGIYKASARRDLTMNAMAINIETEELLDPFGGQEDIKKSVLRSPDITFFNQDPLRFFRVMQFISRFSMYPDDQLNALCKKMDISTVSRERIALEFEKMLLKSDYPSYGIRWLQEIDRLKEILPELHATVGIEQDIRWHPEGDVFEHTMQTVDAAARILYDNQEIRLCLLLAALCHDLGKVSTTQKTAEKITSYGHEMVSAKIAQCMLHRITDGKVRIKTVVKLVRAHMMPFQFIVNKAKAAAYKGLAHTLSPETYMYVLADLSRADKQGRNPHKKEPLVTVPVEIDLFIEQAKKAGVLYQQEEPIVHGKDLLPWIEPGKRMGDILKKIYEIQINEDVHDKRMLIKRALKL